MSTEQKSTVAETITIHCACGRYLRGTVERESPEPLPLRRFDTIKLTASQVVTVCPGCGQIATTPLELSHSPSQ